MILKKIVFKTTVLDHSTIYPQKYSLNITGFEPISAFLWEMCFSLLYYMFLLGQRVL